MHPREETANRFLLRRAERRFTELAFVLREQLSVLLDAEPELRSGEQPVCSRRQSRRSPTARTRTRALTRSATVEKQGTHLAQYLK